jgi:hypothetical protein
MASKKENGILEEDGQHVTVEYPGESLQDQAKRKQAEELGGDPNYRSLPIPSDKEDKALAEVRAIRDENERLARTHDRTEIHRQVQASSRSGDLKGKPVELHVFGGRAYLNTHGEAVLDRDGIIQLRQDLDAAHQAVS